MLLVIIHIQMSAFLWWISTILFAWFCWSCSLFISEERYILSKLFLFLCILFLLFKPSVYVELNAYLNYDGCFVAFVDWILLKPEKLNLPLCTVSRNIPLSAWTSASRKQYSSTWCENENNFCIWVDTGI